MAFYIPVVQVSLALFLGQMSVLLNSAILGSSACAVRTVAISVVVATAVLWKQVRIGIARGADSLFEALRPMVLVWTVAMVTEQLLRSCGRGSRFSTMRSLIFHSCTVILTSAGFARAARPCSDQDWQFMLAMACLVAMAALPPAFNDSEEGPLCGVPDVFQAIERMARTMAFASLYSTMAVVEAPPRHTLNDIALTVFRATAASIWTLAVQRVLLVLVLPQMVVAVWKCLELHHSTYNSVSNDSDAGTEDDDHSKLETPADPPDEPQRQRIDIPHFEPQYPRINHQRQRREVLLEMESFAKGI